jgi:hypothetical protein
MFDERIFDAVARLRAEIDLAVRQGMTLAPMQHVSSSGFCMG